MRFDLLTKKGLESACNEFEEMGRNLNPIGHIVAASTAAQAAYEMESEIQKGKRPSAEIPFREFFSLLMITASEKESDNEPKSNGG